MGTQWAQSEWSARESDTRNAILSARSNPDRWRALTRSSRAILRNYSTSFFLVTRFLPPSKRPQVDVIYAAVRFPDEIVDTFPLPPESRHRLLTYLRHQYIQALQTADLTQSVAAGINPWIAGFAEVVRNHNIPPEHYLAFLDAMAADANPRTYRDLNDLIENYIYGSAIVVGYFLAHVYGPSEPAQWQRTLDASRNLAIALQLTNFLRDTAEDERRGRAYLPQDLLESDINAALRRISGIAEEYYHQSELDLNAFAPDCQIAIKACIDVYRRLNQRIGVTAHGIHHRASVPMIEKFNALPNSKFWRVPLAYLGAL